MILITANFAQWKIDELRKRMPSPDGVIPKTIWCLSMLFEVLMLLLLCGFLWAIVNIWVLFDGEDGENGFA